mmetsp:Transcript_19465/g.73536  ORF Transcript_19465/g.73536 Transcript_19465/m.73536 type:complete len:338 (-) Transcript_19465:1450-2463(-)
MDASSRFQNRVDVSLAELLDLFFIVVQQMVGPLPEKILHLLCRHLRWIRCACLGLRIFLRAEFAGSENGLLEPELPARSVKHLCLEAPSRDQPIHPHVLRLPDSVAACHRLHVILRVPVRVVDDHGVRRREIDPDAARPGAEQEDEGILSGVEAVDGLLPVVSRDRPVEALTAEAAMPTEVLQEIQHADHLAEDEHLVALPLQLGEKLVHQHHLPAGCDDALLDSRRVELRMKLLLAEAPFAVLPGQLAGKRFLQLIQAHVLDPTDEERMIAHLPELDVHVQKLGDRPALCSLVQEGVVLLEDRAIELLLQSGQLHVDDGLFFRGNVRRHILLHATQ